MNRRRRLLCTGLAAALLSACGSVRLDGLGDGGNSAVGGNQPDPSDGGARDGGPLGQPSGPGPAPGAPGLLLRRARFVEGFEASDWQCTANLCLRGGITQ